MQVAETVRIVFSRRCLCRWDKQPKKGMVISMDNKQNLALSAPHIRRPRDTRDIMRDVCIALLPVVAAALWFFRLRALWLLLVTTAACGLTEWACLRLRKSGADFDGSAAVTGLLLALSLPAGTNLFAAALAGIFAIAVVKHLFGGIGHNILNPAMAGRALLMAAWPASLHGYEWADAASSATPLVLTDREGLWPMLWGAENGSMGETSALLILLGGAYLLAKGCIRLRMPVACLWSFALFTWIFGGERGLLTGDAAAQLLSGGLMLGAFFMVTDFTGKPATFAGELIYAAGIGVLTAVLRIWGPYPEGMCFAILLMSLATPLIEYLTRPPVYGTRPALAAAPDPARR